MTRQLGRRDVVTLFGSLAVSACAASPAPTSTVSPQQVWPPYERSIVIDALGGPGAWVCPGGDDAPLANEMIADARASGVTAVNVTVGVVGNRPDAFEASVQQIASWENELDRRPAELMKIKAAVDLVAAKRSGRLGIIYGFQDAAPIGSDLTRLELFRRLGVRIMQPTYNLHNLLGDGCLVPENGGLTPFGLQAIERMNALRIVVDLSHSGQRTTADAIAASKRPVAITHTGCAALVPLPRNKRDEELRATAVKGGVVGIYLMPFLRASGQPTAADVIRHIEHAVNICGEDHVGIGTDGFLSPTPLTPEFKKVHREFVAQRQRDGVAAPGEDANVFNFVPEIDTVRRMETLARALAARGHSESRVQKVLGGNFARLFGEIWG